MIFYVSGRLEYIDPNFVVLDVNGMGYKVTVPETLSQSLPAIGETVKLYTVFHVREDQQQLFGFLSTEDKAVFLLLTSVSGVGPKVGIKILSTLAISDLIPAIQQENLAVLTSVSGVGKKMAERVIIELKDKVAALYAYSESEKTPTQTTIAPSLSDDLTLALKTLGYNSEEIKRAIKQASAMLEPTLSLENSIKIILKYL
jgi:Holliday junction DNA helicase RuvA